MAFMRFMFWVWAGLSVLCAATHDWVLMGVSLAFATWDGYNGYGRRT